MSIVNKVCVCVCRNEVLIKLVNGLYRPPLHSLIILITIILITIILITYAVVAKSFWSVKQMIKGYKPFLHLQL